METVIKTFSGWLNSFKKTSENNKFIFSELKELDKMKNEFRYQHVFLKEDIGNIRKTYDHLTIYTAMKEKDFDGYTRLGVHKILFRASDKAKCWDYIDKILHQHGINLINKLDHNL